MALVATALLPSLTADAAPTTSLSAALNPKRLGYPTTIHFGFTIRGEDGRLPPPLTQVEVQFPVGFAVSLSELGLASCSPHTLQVKGPIGCPRNAIMGHGRAIAAVPFAPEAVSEEANITIVRAEPSEQPTTMLFYAEAWHPLIAELTLPALLLPAQLPYGGKLKVEVPLLSTLPDGADASVVRFQASIGPEHLVYLGRAHGHRILYKPRGIPTPEGCPRKGFQFAADFAFQDNSHSIATTVVHCPAKRATG